MAMLPCLGEKMKLCDTIAAISTPFGKGGVAMIRISGENAIEIADRVFLAKRKKPLAECASREMIYGEIFSGTAEKRVSIDDGCAVVFRAPASFTGEESVELYCHGGVLVTSKVLSAVLAAGARLAVAGEITRRAFVNGKMSLNEAESLGNLLEASNDAQVRLARNGMRGSLDKRLLAVYDDLRSVMSGMFAAIDFPDEDLSELSREEMIAFVKKAVSEVSALLATYNTGRAVLSGIPTVICGRTNAGKSSVYNRLLGYDAAIVTDIEGTTRDVLKEQASVGGVTLLLCDTAGIRKTDDRVENIGIERAIGEIDASELALAVFDASVPLTSEDIELIKRLVGQGKVCIALLNKSDLVANTDTTGRVRAAFENCIDVCADSGEGFDKLTDMINALFIDGNIDMDNDAIVTGARQFADLTVAQECLGEALAQLEQEIPFDLCCVGIENAMAAIGQVGGREISEDIVAEIFSKFCVGK